MKQIIYIVWLCSILLCNSVNAETLYLKRGKEIKCNSIWIKGDKYACEIGGGGTIFFDKEKLDLKKINEVLLIKEKELQAQIQKERKLQAQIQKERKLQAQKIKKKLQKKSSKSKNDHCKEGCAALSIVEKWNKYEYFSCVKGCTGY